jgi:hypothetical protein
MADQSVDQMIAAATGGSPSASPSAPPATPSPAAGPSSISIGGTESSTTPESTAPSQGGGSVDDMIAQATGTPSTQSADGTNPPSGGFLQGLGEGSNVGGVGSAIKAAVQDNQAQGQRALDIYHQMVAAHASGDSKGAAEAASKFLLTTTSQGLQKAYAPFIEAAKMVVMDPINAIQKQRELNQKVQADQAAGKENPNTMKAVWDRAKQDWKLNNPDAALTDVLAGTVGQPGMNAIPLVGPMVSSMANHLNEATHRPGGEDYGRVIGNVVGSLGAAAAGGLVGKGAEALSGAGATGAVEGLEAGQAGADAAGTAADTAKLHDNILQANKDQFQSALDAATQKAQDTRDAAVETQAGNKVDTSNDTAERAAAHKDLVEQGRDAQHTEIDSQLEKAKSQYADQFKQSLQTQSTGAAPPEDLAPKINEGIDRYEQKSHEDFEEGMNGEGGVIEQLEGHTEPVIGSPLQQKAAELLKKPTPGDHPLQLGAKNLAGVKLDSNVQKYLQNASEGMVEVEAPGPADEAGNPTTQMVKKPMGDLTADQLVGIRQNLREAATQFQRGDLNRRVLGDMINATDNTLEKLATAADNPDVLQQYEGLRKNYKTARANLDTSTADKLRLDSPDKAMGDVNKYLLQGNNAPAKIRTIGSMVGDETMQGLRQSYIQQLSEMAPEDAMKALAKIPDATKQEFFGPELDGRLAAAQSLYKKSVTAAEQNAAATKDYVSNAAAEALDRNSSQLIYDRQANSAEAVKANAKIKADYQDAVDQAKEVFKQASAPYDSNFTKSISKGTLADDLADGKIATADITSLKDAMDPHDFAKIQTGTWNRAQANATTGGRFNAVKFAEWIDSAMENNPNAFDEMFSMNPENTIGLKKAVANVRDAATMQKLVRAGIGTPVAATALSILPHTPMALVYEMAGLMGAAGLESRSAFITTMLDTIATRPTLLKALARTRNTVTGIPAMVGDATKAALPGAPSAATVGAGAGATLGADFGRQVTVDGQPGTQVGIHPDSGKPVIMYHPGGAQ